MVLDTSQYFQKLIIPNLKIQAFRWAKKYDYVDRISLYAYKSRYQRELNGRVPTKYAVVFVFPKKVVEKVVNSCAELHEVTTDDFSLCEFQVIIGKGPEKELEIDTEYYQTVERKYLSLIDADFENVYRNRAPKDFWKQWLFIPKRVDEPYMIGVEVDGTHVVLYDRYAAEFDAKATNNRRVLKHEDEEHLKQSDKGSESTDYMLRLEGDIWELIFEGRRYSIKIDGRLRLTGLKYIRYLIYLYVKNDYSPHKPIYPLCLEIAVEGAHPDTTDERIAQEIVGGASETPCRVDTESINEKEKKRLIKAHDDLKMELKKAQENNDLGNIEKARNKLEKYEETIKKEYSHLFIKQTPMSDPKDSEFSDRKEKARKRVSIKIDRALKKIKDYNQGLFAHLKDSIKKEENALSYRPSQKIKWII